MGNRSQRDATSGAAFGLAGGCAAVIVAALIAAVLIEPGSEGGRLLMMAVTAGVLARFVEDWRASVGVTVAAALIYVGFLANTGGDLTADATAWPYTVAIAFAALLGRGQRWMHAIHADHEASPVSAPR